MFERSRLKVEQLIEHGPQDAVAYIDDPMDGGVCPDYPEISREEADEYLAYSLEAARIVVNSREWKE